MSARPDYWICACGKRAFSSPTRARKAHACARFRLRLYHCPHGSLHVSAAEKGNREGLYTNPAEDAFYANPGKQPRKRTV